MVKYGHKGIIYSLKVPVFGLCLYVYCRMCWTFPFTLSYYNNNVIVRHLLDRISYLFNTLQILLEY